ncbi:multidrug effflux MFS transporter [Chondromyces apiculatus]|nr:multidrug effflux MFS transporter [Chondromyces apiculatus]
MNSANQDVSVTTPNVERGKLRVLIILGALMSFASISTDMYLPAFPTMQRELGGAAGDIELTLSSFLAGFAVGQLLWGPIGDRYGRRLPIAVGLVLFVLGSIGCASSTSVMGVVVWRVVQAVGACSGPVLARAMARVLYAGERAAQMLSTLILIMMAAPLLGPLLGGQLLVVWSWQGIFWVLAVVGILALFGLPMLPETLPPDQRVRAPLGDVLTDYVALVRNPRLMGFALSSAFFYAGMYVFIAGSPFVYIEYFGVPSRDYGLLFGVNIVGMMVTNFLNTRLVMRLGSERLFRANAVAGVLAEAPGRAGAASSLVGAMQYGSGVASAALVGWLADGTPRPMSWLMGASGVAALATALLVKRER